MSDAPESENTNLPAKTETPAEKQRKRMDALITTLETRSTMLRTLLNDTGISFEQFVEVFRRALMQNPDLVKVEAGSVIKACIDAATDGLKPDGKEGAIVVRSVNVAGRGQPKRWEDRAQFQSMYGGLLKVAYRSGNFASIEARVVYEGDEFEYVLGDDPKIIHKPAKRPARAADAPPIPIVAAYAVAKTVNGGVFREVFEGEDIRQVNAVSKATRGPGASWPSEMARKGPLRRLMKFLPKSPAMERLIERDNDGYDVENLAPITAPGARKLSPGFAPPPQQQLTEGADMVVPEVEEEGEFAPIDAGTASEGAESGGMRAETPVESPISPDERAETPRPVDETPLPPGLDTFALSVKVATSWLNIKQALRTLAKHGAWQEGPEWPAFAYPLAWARFRELEDKTDICQDLILFETWIRAADPMPMAAEANWALLQKMEVFTKAGDDVKGRLEALVKAVVGEQGDGE